MQIKLKKKFTSKAFTLIELLAVIIILGILSFLIIPSTINYVFKTKEHAYQLLIDNIENTTRLYIDDYRDTIQNIDVPGQEIFITLDDLISRDMLTEPVIDPRNDKEIKLDTKIYIYVYGNNRFHISIKDLNY